jgi:hypothetical protein
MPYRRLVVLTSRRHPHELMLLVVSVLQGAAYAIGQPRPNSVAVLLPPVVVTAWYVLLLVSGVVGLTGNLWPGHLDTALRLRLSGNFLAAAPAAVYGITLLAFGGLRGSFAASIVLAWAGACMWRAWQLRADLRQIGDIA